jgi:hypothetical protein
MPYTCPFCHIIQSSHSLKQVFERNGVLYYYTCPSQARMYYDAPSIIHHYKGVLSEIPETKEWIWIFDSKGFTVDHAMQTTVAIELAQLLSTFTNLKKIIIINPTFYVKLTYHVVLPFLNTLKYLVEMNYDVTCPEEL